MERLGRLLAAARVRALLAAGAVAVGALVVALALADGEDPAEPAPSDAAGQGARAEATDRISALLEEMAVERKVAQLMLVGFEGIGTGDPVFSELEQRDYAGLVVDARNYVNPDQVEGLADEAVSVARRSDHVTPWIMAPQEGGEFRALDDLPPSEAPAEVGSPGEAGRLARETGDALLDVGVTGILAPVLDVGPEGGGAVGPRAYSDIPEQVTGYAIATVGAYDESGIFAAAKHFPGLGGASQPTELGPANVGLTLDELAQRDLLPFRAAIERGVPAIVVGHGIYAVDDFVTPASMSPTVVGDLLRDDLGFEGVAIADDVTSPAVTATVSARRAAVVAVRAGVDMVYLSGGEDIRRAVYGALLEAVGDGTITAERLDEALRRSLAAKREAGLLPRPPEEQERDRPAASDRDRAPGGPAPEAADPPARR